MPTSTEARDLMHLINAVRKDQAKEIGEYQFLTPPAVPLICFSALVTVADKSGYWEGEDAREECVLGLAMLAQLTRLMVLASVDPKEPVSNEQLAGILNIETNTGVLELVATAIGMSPAWPTSAEVH